MNLITLRRLATLGAAIAVLASGSVLAEPVGQETLLGEPAAATVPVDKVIVIDANTRWVNVTQDETVKFVVHGAGADQAFAWHFTTSRFSIDLAEVAPRGLLNHQVVAYIASDPLYEMD